MLMRLPLLTRVQKSRGQHQGISPNPQGHTSSSPASIVAEYCLVIATFILLLILPKSRGRRGQQTTVAGEGGRQRHGCGVGNVSLFSYTCGSASSLSHALLPVSKRRRRPRHERSESAVCKENTPSALPHGCAFIRFCTEEDFSLMAQTLFTTKTRALSLSLSWQQDKKAPERHHRCCDGRIGCITDQYSLSFMDLRYFSRRHTHTQEDFLKSASVSLPQNTKLKQH